MTSKEAQIIIGNIPINPEVLDDCYSIAEYQEAKAMAIEALGQQSCENCISRESLRRKLQEHHDFFVNAYGSFEDMNFIKKSRVDEIDNCIAMVVNEPSVTPQRPKGKWIEVFVETPNDPYNYGFKSHKCSKCECRPLQISNYCPNCGAEMNGGEEDE